MALDYRFVPIDVEITTHPKAFEAGIEAMGLWMWGLAFARLHKTDGHLTRAAVLAAWGGKRNVLLAKRLVDSGLWLANEDGSWRIWNFEKKGAGSYSRSSGAERQQRYRERHRNGGDVTRDALSDVTSDVTGVTSASISISSSEVREDLPEIQRDRVGAPEWFVAVLGTIEMATGEKVDAQPAWLRYRGHRATKGMPMSVPDAEYWLTSVVVPELRKERQLKRERDDRQHQREAGPPPVPQPTKEQSQAMADEIMRRVRAGKVGT